jgi:hypothetical protein
MAVFSRVHNDEGIWRAVDLEKTCGYAGKRFED